MSDFSKHGSTLIPSLRYRDAHAAIDWLVRVFGFTKHAVYDGPNGTVAHAQLTHGAGMLMLGSEGNGGDYARHSISLEETSGRETMGTYLVVEDCDAAYAKANAAGAEMIQDLTSPDYGGKSFICRDLEGHIWSFGSYDPWSEQSGEQG